MYPHLNRMFRPVLSSGVHHDTASCTPTSTEFLSFLTELGTFNKPFTNHSDREPICPSFSLPMTRLMHHPQNSDSCTPPALRRRPLTSLTLEGVPLRASIAGLTYAVGTSTIFTTNQEP